MVTHLRNGVFMLALASGVASLCAAQVFVRKEEPRSDSSQEQHRATETEAKPSMIVLGGVELCGPAEAAEEFLTPDDPKEKNRWEKMIRKKKTDRNGVTSVRVSLLASKPIAEVSFGDETGHLRSLMEYKGRVLGVRLFVPGDVGGVSVRTHDEVYRAIVAAKGEPDIRTGADDPAKTMARRGGKVTYEWHEDNKLTIQSSYSLGTSVYVYCKDLWMQSLGQEGPANLL